MTAPVLPLYTIIHVCSSLFFEAFVIHLVQAQLDEKKSFSPMFGWVYVYIYVCVTIFYVLWPQSLASVHDFITCNPVVLCILRMLAKGRTRALLLTCYNKA